MDLGSGSARPRPGLLSPTNDVTVTVNVAVVVRVVVCAVACDVDAALQVLGDAPHTIQELVDVLGTEFVHGPDGSLRHGVAERRSDHRDVVDDPMRLADPIR